MTIEFSWIFPAIKWVDLSSARFVKTTGLIRPAHGSRKNRSKSSTWSPPGLQSPGPQRWEWQAKQGSPLRSIGETIKKPKVFKGLP